LALTHLSRRDEALGAAERAVTLNSQSAAAWLQSSVAALAAGHEDQSQERISRAMALLNWPDWHRQRAHHAFILGRDARAVQSVDVFLARRGWRDAHASYAAFLSASASRRMGRSEARDRILDQVRQHAGLSAGSWTAALLDFV
jgi:tetratricopeptide (TPR) repeat protein